MEKKIEQWIFFERNIFRTTWSHRYLRYLRPEELESEKYFWVNQSYFDLRNLGLLFGMSPSIDEFLKP